MYLKHSSISFYAIFLLLSAFPLAGQAQSITQKPAFEATAVFAEKAPEIDGFLDDEIWQNIMPITNFVQIWPDEGSEATEYSEVRIAYDRDYLYFAFRFHDKEAHLIRAKNLERGGSNSRDDHAYIGLDTFLDGQNAYLFEMNALGTQDDAAVTNEELNYESYSWDAVFYSETNIHAEGWDLEVAIPFRQLRFPKNDELTFGLMVSRMINRKNERVIWPAIGMDFGGSRGALAAVSQYGILKGIKNIRRGNNIEVKPYAIAGYQNNRPDLSDAATISDYTRDVGFDIKYGITSSLTLDMTINTDFAQVESDNVQINLSRFNLFFPEKREFFLERSGLFQHGNSRSTQTFFSRQIGLSEQILGGLRLTGQVGRFSVGLMNIETGNKMNEIFGSQSTNNTVARIITHILPRASVGAIFTNLDQPDAYNRALGVDANFRFWSSSQFNTWFTNVWDSNNANEDAAGHVALALDNDLYGARISYTTVGARYAPALGFVRRLDMRQYSGGLSYSPRVNLSYLPFISRFNFSGDYEYIENQRGNLETTNLSVSAQAEFRQRDDISLNFSRQYENLPGPFQIRPGAIIPAGGYTFIEAGLNARTDDSRILYGSAGFSAGEFYNGYRSNLQGGIGFRQSQHLTIDAGFNYSMIDLPIPNGNFDATTFSVNILSALSRKLFAKTLLQYDNFSKNLQANFRINWIHKPGSDLFLVYNTSYHITGSNEDLFDPRRRMIMNNQTAIVKLTYLILL